MVAHICGGLEWNFVLPPSHQSPPAADVSGSWGCGAWHGRSWFQLRWDERSADLPKELLAIVLAGAPLGAATVFLPLRQSGSGGMPVLQNQSGEPHHAHVAYASFHGGKAFICPSPQYIHTKANHLADDLSRDNLSKVTDANPAATPLPVHLLLDPTIDWLSPHWHHCSAVLPGQPSTLHLHVQLRVQHLL